jgi:hypothetical protein
MHTYPITNESREWELQHIKTVLHNNNYPTSILQNKHKTNHIKDHPVPKGRGHLRILLGKKLKSSLDYSKTHT